MPSVGLLIFPDFAAIGLGCLSVFDSANRSHGSQVYDVHLVSEDGGPVTCLMGVQMNTEAFGATQFDTLIIAGTENLAPTSTRTVHYLQSQERTARRIGAICTGAFHLAHAGLLDGKNATTHWADTAALKDRYPSVKIGDDRIFVVDGKIWTCAGMTAGFDMVLAMIEADLGHEFARALAKKFVMYNQRAGGQTQISALLEMGAKSDRVQKALAFAKENLASRLKVEDLATVATLSPRQFSRAFREETGRSPAKAIEALRVEAAQLLLGQGRLPAEDVAREVGFSDGEQMRKAFLRTLQQPPRAIRRSERQQTQTSSKRTLEDVD